MSNAVISYPLFAVYGIEIEYMIVDRTTLAVLPVTDQIMKKAAGAYVSDFEEGPVAWSNELVLHVLELKTNGPVAALDGLPGLFLSSVRHINGLLEDMNGMLLPTAMHPCMDPHKETRLWPHESSEIYDAFNRIFDCRGHGWSNLQSTHINLPFANDHEFAQLHSALRILLPIMPAIAASSPVRDGEFTGFMDTRLEAYRRNSEKIPLITGLVIPEPAQTREQYLQTILYPMYRAIAPHDPAGTLQHEWLNARGAIARFERNTIEVRILDTQECPAADIAVAALITGVLKLLITGSWSSTGEQLAPATSDLSGLFLDCVRHADATVIRDRKFLRLFAFPDKQCEARELWQYLLESIMAGEGVAAERAGASAPAPKRPSPPTEIRKAMEHILHHGPLARRICKAIGAEIRLSRLQETYRRLGECLAGGTLFAGID